MFKNTSNHGYFPLAVFDQLETKQPANFLLWHKTEIKLFFFSNVYRREKEDDNLDLNKNTHRNDKQNASTTLIQR